MSDTSHVLDVSGVHVQCMSLLSAGQVWDSIGSRTWCYGEECAKILQELVDETDGPELPNANNDAAVGEVCRARIPQTVERTGTGHELPFSRFDTLINC